jgi:hypothetical protein
MSRHLITLAVIASATACSGGITSEAELASLSVPPQAELDGAPPAPAAQPIAVAPPVAIATVPPAPVVARRQDESLWCDIAIKRTTNGIRLTPSVRSDRSVSGEYSLVITKSGRAGSSDISQGGPFDARRNVKQELGASEISLERGATFRAVLKVRSGGHEVCREIRS